MNESIRVNRTAIGTFVPGTSGNPTGRPRRSISQVVRKMEFRRSFLRLIQIRDGRIRKMDFTQGGKRVWVYPDIGNLIAACKLIMEYTAGKPEQHLSLEIMGDVPKPNVLNLVLNRPSVSQVQQGEGSRAIVLGVMPDHLETNGKSSYSTSEQIPGLTDLRKLGGGQAGK